MNRRTTLRHRGETSEIVSVDTEEQFRSAVNGAADAEFLEPTVTSASEVIARVLQESRNNGELPNIYTMQRALEEVSLGHTGIIASLCCLLAAGLTPREAGASVGIDRGVIRQWLRLPSFRLAISGAFNTNAAILADNALADQRRRLASLGEHYDRLLYIIDERAERYSQDLTAPPEAMSGYIQQDVLVNGRTGEEINTYRFDAPLANEVRKTLELAGREAGDIGDTRIELKLYSNMPMEAILGRVITEDTGESEEAA